MTEGLVKQSIAELRDFARCRRYMVDAVQVVAGQPWQPTVDDLAVNLQRLIDRSPDHAPYRDELATIMMELAL